MLVGRRLPGQGAVPARGPGCVARRHRTLEAQRVLLRRRRRGARRRAEGRRVAAVRRRAHGDQGARAGQGLAVYRGVAAVQGRGSRGRRHAGRPRPRCRRRPRGTHDRQRDRLRQLHVDQVERNPWNLERTPGGSSGGSAAAVAGGVVPIASGGDGGGSIRIPSGYSGLFGLKATYGRIPRGPFAEIEPLTVTYGALARSVRDSARWVDVCNGYDPRDPHSLPRVEGWEAGLGTHDLSGLRVAVDPTLGGTVIHPEVEATVLDFADALIKAA